MNQLMSFRQILSHVDFMCCWNNGICFAELKEKNPSPMCCCVVCKAKAGFLTEDPTPAFKSDLVTYEQHWEDATGFWRPSGCSLPAILRNTTCLTYNCLHLIDTKKARNLRFTIDSVRQSMDNLTKEIITIAERVK